MSASYSRKQVRTLLEGWSELHPLRNTWGRPLSLLCQLADIERAVKQLPDPLRHAAFYCGMCRPRLLDASGILGVSRSTVYELYKQALDALVVSLNRGGNN